MLKVYISQSLKILGFFLLCFLITKNSQIQGLIFFSFFYSESYSGYMINLPTSLCASFLFSLIYLSSTLLITHLQCLYFLQTIALHLNPWFTHTSMQFVSLRLESAPTFFFLVSTYYSEEMLSYSISLCLCHLDWSFA